MRLPIALAAAASLATLAVPNAAQALTWNFSFSFDNGQTASGSFETGGAGPVIGDIYTITAINGSQGGSPTQSITGLSNVAGATNTFKWTGGPSLLTDFDGIAWVLQDSTSYNVYYNGFGYSSPTDWGSSSVGGGIVTSSSLSFAPAAVPGPLPLFGAGAAFGWSRRLRRRVKTGSLKVTSLQ
jgi:hypothetical protein